MENLIGLIFLLVLLLVILVKTAVVVPQRSEFVVERLGKYRTTLEAGFHILFPFLDKVAYKRSTEGRTDRYPGPDLYYRRQCDARGGRHNVSCRWSIRKMSAYGIDDYRFAASQLAMTSLRSAIGKITLDNTFEARETLNGQVVMALDEAAANWGIKVLRYEIKDIQPPRTVLEAMEKQMKAEREKRAEIARSEGEKQAILNRPRATGERPFFSRRAKR